METEGAFKRKQHSEESDTELAWLKMVRPGKQYYMEESGSDADEREVSREEEQALIEDEEPQEEERDEEEDYRSPEEKQDTVEDEESEEDEVGIDGVEEDVQSEDSDDFVPMAARRPAPYHASSIMPSSYGSISTGNVIIGQMSIPLGRAALYRKLVDHFGEIVSPNLPKFKVGPTNLAVADLLNAVADMLDITPDGISQELVSNWEEMVTFYNGMGLEVGWLDSRVRWYNDWLVRCSVVDVDQLECKVTAKREALEAKQKEVSNLQKELQELCVELETARDSQSHFDFTFFDQ